MKFIPIDKMKKLRECAKGGDCNAQKILSMQLSGDDFSQQMEEYFKPKVEETSTGAVQNNPGSSKLQQFLSFNGIDENSPDYESYVQEFHREMGTQNPHQMNHQEHCFLDELIKDELEAINQYNQAIMKIMTEESEDNTSSKGLIAKLTEIKNDEIEHLEELRRLKNSMQKKQEGIIVE